MPRRGENIRKRKDGRWEGRFVTHYDANGKAVYRSVYAKTYAEVREKVRVGSMEFTAQEQPQASSEITLGPVAEEWLDAKIKMQKRSTTAKYRTVLDKHILPALGNLPITDFSGNTSNDFMSTCFDAVSDSLYHSIVSVLKSVLDHAVQKKYLKSAVNLKIKRTNEKKYAQTFSDAERTMLEAYLLSDPDCAKLGVYLCLYTGMRIGELCALKWSDIDLFSNIIRIKSTLQRLPVKDHHSQRKTELVITPPKSISSIRDIPIPAHLAALLKKFERSNDLFFLSEKNKPMEPRCLQNKFKFYLKEAGVCEINFHALRHTFASRCIAVGVDIKTVSEVLGHNNVEITLNRYVHTSEEQKRSQLSLLFVNNGQRATTV